MQLHGFMPKNVLCDRADSIVADAELVREALMGKADPQHSRWSLLGQSFGGFCAIQYLSAAPQGSVEVLILRSCYLLSSVLLRKGHL